MKRPRHGHAAATIGLATAAEVGAHLAVDNVLVSLATFGSVLGVGLLAKPPSGEFRMLRRNPAPDAPTPAQLDALHERLAALSTGLDATRAASDDARRELERAIRDVVEDVTRHVRDAAGADESRGHLVLERLTAAETLLARIGEIAQGNGELSRAATEAAQRTAADIAGARGDLAALAKHVDERAHESLRAIEGSEAATALRDRGVVERLANLSAGLKRLDERAVRGESVVGERLQRVERALSEVGTSTVASVREAAEAERRRLAADLDAIRQALAAFQQQVAASLVATHERSEKASARVSEGIDNVGRIALDLHAAQIEATKALGTAAADVEARLAPRFDALVKASEAGSTLGAALKATESRLASKLEAATRETSAATEESRRAQAATTGARDQLLAATKKELAPLKQRLDAIAQASVDLARRFDAVPESAAAPVLARLQEIDAALDENGNRIAAVPDAIRGVWRDDLTALRAGMSAIGESQAATARVLRSIPQESAAPVVERIREMQAALTEATRRLDDFSTEDLQAAWARDVARLHEAVHAIGEAQASADGLSAKTTSGVLAGVQPLFEPVLQQLDKLEALPDRLRSSWREEVLRLAEAGDRAARQTHTRTVEAVDARLATLAQKLAESQSKAFATSAATFRDGVDGAAGRVIESLHDEVARLRSAAASHREETTLLRSEIASLSVDLRDEMAAIEARILNALSAFASPQIKAEDALAATLNRS